MNIYIYIYVYIFMLMSSGVVQRTPLGGGGGGNLKFIPVRPAFHLGVKCSISRCLVLWKA